MTKESLDWEKQLAKDVPFAGERVAINIRKVKERIRLDGGERRKRAIGPWAAALVVVLLGGLFLWRGQEVQDLLARWTDGPNKNTVKPITHDPVTLKVVTNMDERTFYSTYGRLLMLRYNWLSFDVISIQPTANDWQNDFQDFRAKLAQSAPDLLMVSNNFMPTLIQHELVQPLDNRIKQDAYDLNALHPAVPALLRAEGNGKLYGLTPFLQGQALFYNKDLFDKYQVPYPKDHNTWNDLFSLARTFPLSGELGKELIGIEDESAIISYDLIVSQAKGAGLFHQGADKSGWETVWNNVLNGYPGGLIRTKTRMQPGRMYSQEEDLRRSQFLSGKAAMAIAGYGEVTTLQGAESLHLPSFKWGLVTPPVEPNHPDESDGYVLGDIFAIASSSARGDDAWETIRALMGPELEKSMLKAQNANSTFQSSYMMSIPSVMEGAAGQVDLKPFYELKPAVPSKEAADLSNKLFPIGAAKATSAINGELTTKEAFDAFWRQAEPILQGGGQP